MNFSKIKNQSGAAAILTVIIVASASLIIALSATQLGLVNLENAYMYEKGQGARIFLDTCAEETLERLRKDSSYTGSVLSFNGNECIINIVEIGSLREINLTGSVDDYHREYNLEVDLSDDFILINSWFEY